MLKITVKNDIDKLAEFLDEFQQRALVKATRMAMNRSVMSLRTQANRMAREERKLKQGDINKDYFKITKASGNNLGTLHASLEISGKPMSLIRFVLGPAEKFSQAGIKIADRRKVKVEVKPGRKVELKGAFIGEGRSGNFHVFRRRGPKRHPIVKQSAPSLAVVFERKLFRDRLEAFMKGKFASEFQGAMTYEVQRLKDKQKATTPTL